MRACFARRPQYIMKHWHNHHRVLDDASRRGCSTNLPNGASRVCKWNTSPSSHHGSLDIVAASSHSTAVLAAYFSQHAQSAGDCFLLFGNVGAGKSHFSREYIRFALGKEDMDVPSPTYLLHNTYTHPNGVDIHHYDLYRLQGKSEMEYSRLDLNHSLETGVCLIEWPEKLIEMGVVPEERLELHLSHMDEDQDQDDDEDSKRLIHLNWFGERWGQLVLTLAEHVQDRGSSLGLEMAS